MSALRNIAAVFTLTLALASVALAAAASTRADLRDALDARAYEPALIMVDELLADEPDDAELRFSRALIRFRLGDFAGAERDYARLVQEYPGNVDYVFGLAQALAAQDDDQAALAALGQAVRLAPDYEDVWRLEHRLLLRQSDAASVARLQSMREAAATRFPRSTWYLGDEELLPRRWELQVGFSHDELSGDRTNWTSRFAQIARLTAGGDRYALRFASDERYELSDRQLGIAADWQLGAEWTVGLAASFAGHADFTADRQYSAHAGRPIGSGWSVDLGVRRREFASASADSYALLTEKYFGDFRAAGSVALTHLHDAGNSLGYSLYFNWYPRPALSVGIVGTTGAEAEAVGAGQVLETDVSGIALTGRYRFRGRWTIDAWLGTHDQGDFYRRQYAGMALSVGL